MISIFKVKIFSLYTYLKKIQNCHKTKKLLKLGPLFMFSFGTYDIEVHVEVRNEIKILLENGLFHNL
jgi:hypothetical protein